MKLHTALFTLTVLAAAACASSQPETKADAAPTPPTPPTPPTAKAEPPPAPTEIPITAKSPEVVTLLSQAMELQDKSKSVEAEALVRKAVALDAESAFAQSMLAPYETSPKSGDAAKKARELSKGVGEIEREWIEVQVAWILGEPARMLEAEKKLGALMPDHWRVLLILGARAANEERYADAVALYQKSIAAKESGQAHNMMGYAYLALDKVDDAVAAFKKYAAHAPDDANAHDSLGDALLRAGKNEEAEASFQKALSVDKNFVMAWTGVALSRAARGNWPGALEAMQKHVEGQPRVEDKPWALTSLAWWQFAAGKEKDALKSFDAAEKEMVTQKLEVQHAFFPLYRAEMAAAKAKSADALKHVAEAEVRAAKVTMPQGSANSFKSYSLGVRLRALSDMRKKDDAAKLAADLEAFLKTLPDDASRASQLHEMKGDMLAAAGDQKGALAEYAQCWRYASSCLARGITLASTLKDTAAADAMKKALLSSPMRNDDYVVARSQAKLFPAK